MFRGLVERTAYSVGSRSCYSWKRRFVRPLQPTVLGSEQSNSRKHQKTRQSSLTEPSTHNKGTRQRAHQYDETGPPNKNQLFDLSTRAY